VSGGPRVETPARPSPAAEAPPAPERRSARFADWLASTPEVGVVGAVVVIVAVLASVNSSFVSVDNLQTIGRDLGQYGILAVGESFPMLTGGIDLSPGSITAFSGVFAAWLNVDAHVPAPLAAALVLLVAAAIGFVHGLFVTRLDVPPFVITLVTLVTGQGAALAITKGLPIDNVDPVFNGFVITNVLGFPPPTILFAVICVAVWFFLERTYIGRQLYAVGGNREAARLAGIRANRRIVLAYVVSATSAGLVGMLVLGRLNVGEPGVAVGWELTAIASAVIGGVSLFGGSGRVVGVAFGAVLLEVINNGLIILHVSPYYQQIVLGAVLATAITLDRLRARRSARRR
jgi:ribose transport system permease protein